GWYFGVQNILHTCDVLVSMQAKYFWLNLLIDKMLHCCYIEAFKSLKKIKTMKTSRRKFMQQALKASALTAIGSSLVTSRAFSMNEKNIISPALQFSQVALPYSY